MTEQLGKVLLRLLEAYAADDMPPSEQAELVVAALRQRCVLVEDREQAIERMVEALDELLGCSDFDTMAMARIALAAAERGGEQMTEWVFTPTDPTKTLTEIVQEIVGKSEWCNDPDIGVALVAAGEDGRPEPEGGWVVWTLKQVGMAAGSVIHEASFDLLGEQVRVITCLAERHCRAEGRET